MAGNSFRADVRKAADLICAILERHMWGTLEHIQNETLLMLSGTSGGLVFENILLT